MARVKRITANLPEDLLREALQSTGKGITETLVQGLRLVRRSAAFTKGEALKGKLDIQLDLELSRERRRR